MKILTKFIGFSLVALGLTAAVTYGSGSLLNQAQESAEVSHDKVDQVVENFSHLEASLSEQIIALKDFRLLNSQDSIIKYKTAKSEFLAKLDEMEQLMPDAVELEIIRRRHEFLVRLATELSNSSSSSQENSLADSQQDFRALNSFKRDIDFFLDELIHRLRQEDLLAEQKVAQLRQIDQVVTQVFIGLILLVFVGQFRLILLPLIQSIEKLQVGAEKIGTGNLDYRLNIQTKDEIQQLANEFNCMAAKLAESYHSLKEEIIERKQAENTLRLSEAQLIQQTQQVEQALQGLQKTQAQLIQAEKMSSLGQLVAGVAHEINNPVNFIYGNLTHTYAYIENLLQLVHLYQQHYPNPEVKIEQYTEQIDLDFLIEDLPKMLSSMKVGTDRIRQIVTCLRNFSRLDEAEMKAVNLHEGIDSTLLILQNRLKAKPDHPGIQVIKEYGKLPLVECYAGQLNQVFINILSNAIDALEQRREVLGAECGEIFFSTPSIWIRTAVLNADRVVVRIADNGLGMPELVKQRLFDPFFTTKPVGKGTGLGLSISYQIVVEKHGGVLRCQSELGKGTEFWIEIPKQQYYKTVITPQLTDVGTV